MTHRFHAVAMSLALVTTFAILAGVDTLATQQHAALQLASHKAAAHTAAASVPAAPRS